MNPIELNNAYRAVTEEFKEVAKKLVGRQVRIKKFYIGFCGRSSKNLEGTVQRIASAVMSDYAGLVIWLEGYEYGITALTVDQWELIQ